MSKETNFSMSAILLFVMFILFTANIQAQSPHQFGPSYLPQRVYDSKEKRFSDFEAMMADLSRTDVVFVGEKHDDPATHRLEQAILTSLLRRKVGVSVSLEMFERDVQQTLDSYLTGKLSEEEFLKTSRPWPNYPTDYRPLVEMAHAHQWPVIAANVPRRYASQVSRQGLAALDALPEAERKMAAAQFQCPFDDYFKKFSEVMNSHPGGDSKSAQKDEKKEAEMRAMTEKFYFAQCVKDETMAESISAHFDQIKSSPTKSVIVHYNGSFHSDNKLGTAARLIRRQPKAKIKVISIVPVEDLDSIKPDEFRKRGDYIVFCLQPTKTKDTAAR